MGGCVRASAAASSAASAVLIVMSWHGSGRVAGGSQGMKCSSTTVSSVTEKTEDGTVLLPLMDADVIRDEIINVFCEKKTKHQRITSAI